MWAHPNDTIKFADVPKTGIKVSARRRRHGKYLSQVVEKAPGSMDDVVGVSRRPEPTSWSTTSPSAPMPRRSGTRSRSSRRRRDGERMPVPCASRTGRRVR
jgi:hypothetical protein